MAAPTVAQTRTPPDAGTHDHREWHRRFNTIARPLEHVATPVAAAVECQRMLGRRDFLAGTAAVLFAPLSAVAQPAGGAPRIAFLFYGSAGRSPEIEAFRKGLAELGYIEAQNVAIEYRFAGERPERLPELEIRAFVIEAPERFHRRGAHEG